MTPTRRCILGVFAHPDDETSCAGGTFSRYAHAGVDVYVATATRGEQGTLGTNGQVVTRADLPRVWAMELCTTTAQPRLYYKALLPSAMQALGLTLTGPEVEPTVVIDIAAQKALKVCALRTYTTQEDAQRLAGLVEQSPWAVEAFHQAYPPTSTRVLATGFWEEPTIFTLPSGSACFGEQL